MSSQNTAPARPRPWVENPTGLVNWWDMQQFFGEYLCGLAEVLEKLRLKWMSAHMQGDLLVASMFRQDVTVSGTQLEQLKEKLAGVERSLQHCGLFASGEAVREFQQELTEQDGESPKITDRVVVSRIEEIERTVRREMKAVVFLYVPAEHAHWYASPVSDWDDVIARWPDTKGDIAESSRCLALDRWAGALFHVLLVAEFGVIQVGNLLQKSGDRPGWGCVDRLKKILEEPFSKRSPLEQQHSKLLEGVMPEMETLKADRHRLMHTDNRGDWLVRDIGPNTANDAIGATRKFMRRLASDLPR